jgi:hypothetical protein
MSKYAILIVAILVVGATAAAFAGPAGAASSPTRRLGFWLQDGDALKYPATTFFNSMFLTPPYPSSLEVMIFAIQQDQMNNFGCSASTPYVSGAIKYWGQVAQLADSYPNIRLIFEVAYDPSSGGSGTYGLQCYNTIVKALGQYQSVYAMGVEGEYTTADQGMTQAQMQTAMSDVTATGKLFVSYYIYSPLSIPSSGYAIDHTNFPAQGDQLATLQMSSSQGIGLSSGYYGSFAFPSSVACPIGATSIGSGAKQPQGWDQCVVSTELSTAVSMSASQRQFLEFAVGFSSSGSFTGVSGQSTNQVWDNPTLRNWIWTDPNYQSNFILSTGSSVTATSAVTTSQTTTTTSTRSSTTSTVTAATSTTTADPPSQGASYSLSTAVSCPSGIQYCGNASPVGTGSYSTVTLTGYPYGGYALGYWSVCTSTCQAYYGNPLTLTLSADTKATAVFVVDRSN